MEENCYEYNEKAVIVETPLRDFVVVYVVNSTGVLLIYL